MKKVMVALFMLVTVAVNAQDFKKVQTSFLLTKVSDAKTEIDKIMADPKAQSKAEAWLWKARIYGALFADSTARKKDANLGPEAFTAFKKYLELEPDAKLLNEAGLQVVDQIYVPYFTMGIDNFRDEKWAEAYTHFKNTAELGEIITKRGWKKQGIDTLSTLYAGFSAQNAKKSEEALKYYTALADLKVSAKEFETVYDFLTVHYLNTKNKEQFNKYTALAKQYYPTQKIWAARELAFLEDNSSVDDKLKMFSDAEAAGKLTSEEYFSYGTMFANNRSDEKADSVRDANIKKKAIAAFQKAYELDPTNGIAAYNAGVLYTNEWLALRDRYDAYRGATPALKAKRAEIDKQSAGVIDQAIEWHEKGFTLLDAKKDKSSVEKNSLKNAVKSLTNLYEEKRNKSKGVNPKDYDKYDAKFKFYESKI